MVARIDLPIEIQSALMYNMRIILTPSLYLLPFPCILILPSAEDGPRKMLALPHYLEILVNENHTQNFDPVFWFLPNNLCRTWAWYHFTSHMAYIELLHQDIPHFILDLR